MGNLNPLRTPFPDARGKVFIICADNDTGYSDLVAKYGESYVKQWASGAAFNYCIGAVVSGRGDVIQFQPGSYTITQTMTVNKTVTITGGESPEAVRFDASAAGGADVVVFTVAAAGDYAVIKNLKITGDDSATPSSAITVAGEGVVIEKVIFVGADVDVATAAIDVNAPAARIVGCEFYDYRGAIDLGAAARCVVDGNTIVTDNDAAVGVNCSGVCSWSTIKNNIFNMTGGTGDDGILVDDTALLVAIHNNLFAAGLDDPIVEGAGGTILGWNLVAGSATADAALIIT